MTYSKKQFKKPVHAKRYPLPAPHSLIYAKRYPLNAIRLLAIETSCDETSLAIFQGKKMLSHLVASQEKLHARTGGVVPEVASRAHLEIIFPLLRETLTRAKCKLADLDAIAVTAGPGLLGALLIGVEVARMLGSVLDIPVYPINHLEGHLYANWIQTPRSLDKLGMTEIGLGMTSSARDDSWAEPKFPTLSLIVSGGHTQLLLMRAHGRYELLGETLDDAAGEALDKVGKLLGLGYPGGPAIEKAAVGGDPARFSFPRGLSREKNYNFSFSGLKTAALYKVQSEKSKVKSEISDFAASFQEAVIDSLAIKTAKALETYRPYTLMLGGGVAANKELRKRFVDLSKKYKVKLSIPEFKYCTDNAAMIGMAAYYKIKNKKENVKKDWDVMPVWSFA